LYKEAAKWGNRAIVNSPRATTSPNAAESLTALSFFFLLLSFSQIIGYLVSRISFQERNYISNASGIGAITRALCMHSVNAPSSASYRAWRMVTIFTTSSRILWPAFDRPWPAPRYKILTHLCKERTIFRIYFRTTS